MQTRSRPFTALLNEMHIALKKQGNTPDLINLGLGNPGTIPDTDITSAAAPPKEERLVYGSPIGNLDTRKAMANFLTEVRHSPYVFDDNVSQIALTRGITDSIQQYLTALSYSNASVTKSAIVMPKLRVAVPTPAYAWYFDIIHNNPALEVIKINTSQTDWKLDAVSLMQTLSQEPPPDVLLLNYPSNPTGTNLSEDQWRAVGFVLERHVKQHPEFRILLDNAYADLQFSTPTSLLTHSPSLANHIVEFNSVAKYTGFSGREGPGFAVSQNIEDIEMLRKRLNPSLGLGDERQAVLVKAFDPNNFSPEKSEKIIGTYRRRCHFVANYINYRLRAADGQNHQVALTPEGGMFVFADMKRWLGKKIAPREATKLKREAGVLIPDHREFFANELFKNNTINDDKDLSLYLALKAHVVTMPGQDFGIDGNEGMIRLALGDINQMTQYNAPPAEFASYLPGEDLEGKPLDDLRKLKSGIDQMIATLKELEIGYRR
jgi:aspartate/methionine/tyrosine aminotransferase